MTRAARALAAAVTVWLLLAGCTETSRVGVRQSTDRTEPSAAAIPAPSASDLAAQKKAAGIADCPMSDRDAPAVAGGLPDVVLTCLGGGRDVHLAGLRGRPMLVNVWAQWCGPCRTEAPYLSEVAGEDSNLLFLGVDFVDPQPGLAIEFAQLAGWRYPQLVDGDKVLAAPLQMIGPPKTLFVRTDGTVAGSHAGPFTSAQQIRDLARKHLGVQL
ncbi:MAG TPA: TlpA disulfide reductase family protein [Propionibacteriaceae bacterium]|jgi:thiol-disulfide isomerase/thioredoxin